MVESVPPSGRRWAVGSLARIPLGLAVLAGERLRTGAGLRPAPPAVGSAGALAVGLAESAVTAAGHQAASVSGAVAGVGRRTAHAVAARVRGAVPTPVARLAAAPTRRIRSVAASPTERTIARGRTVLDAARADAVALLDRESPAGLAWVRDRVRPVIIADVVAGPPARPASQRLLLGRNSPSSPH